MKRAAISCAVLLFGTGCVATVGVAPNPQRYPHLSAARDALQRARTDIHRAEEAHAQRGTLGGHGGQAMQALEAAQFEVNQAMGFADANMRPGTPGAVTPKPPLNASPDDVRYPNLGNARLEAERAIRNLEDAEQYHGPIGSLGGHGAAAVQHCRRAIAEIAEAERWADTHR